MKEKVRVDSLDFDGCVFNFNYNHSTNKDVIAHNKSFLDTLKQDHQNFSIVYTMIGSTRQSKEIDVRGSVMNESGSCFPAIRQISRYLKSTLMPLLMPDIWADLPVGTSYHRLMSDYSQHERHHCHLIDESKLTILYAQIHHIAYLHPDAEIFFDFYDDLSEILRNLFRFFSQYPEMLPMNVVLRLNQYMGSHVNSMQEIKGTGTIDANFRQTTVNMMELTGIDLCFMSADKAIEMGFRCCYVWDGEKFSYINRDYNLREEMPVNDTALFYLFNDLSEPVRLRVKQAFIQQLMDSDRYTMNVRGALQNALKLKCVDELTPDLLADYQSNILEGVSILEPLYTCKTTSLQLIISDIQKSDDTVTYDPNINIPEKSFEMRFHSVSDDSFFNSRLKRGVVRDEVSFSLDVVLS